MMSELKIHFVLCDFNLFNLFIVFQVSLEEAKKKILTEMKVLEGKLSDLKDTTSDLKVQLYAKFGNRINLEED